MRKHLTPARAARTAAGVLLAAAPTAYAGFGHEAREGGDPYVETHLFFGTARPGGGPAVTDRQFTAFVDQEVTPGFPDGLTVQAGRGQWRDASGTIEKERSYELILLYPVDREEESGRRIEEIRHIYRTAFGQEAVGRVDERAQADF
ncbi:DUF3574 domain-containing protein [Streptomyces sp. NPDC058964]|uniref:DUF3574 domain-containing protein n=1 Tax=Streptomyces sp. NPDC058964 TaxID=3346681 RepID=UPI0036A81C37